MEIKTKSDDLRENVLIAADSEYSSKQNTHKKHIEMHEKCPSQINKLILMGVSCDSKFNVGELKWNQRKCRTFKRTTREFNINE